MNKHEAVEILSECIEYIIGWMQEVDITINGDDATMAMRSAVLSVTEGFVKKIRNGSVSEYDRIAYAGMLLANQIVEQAVNDEGADGVTLRAEYVSYDEMIRRKAQAEVDEINEDQQEDDQSKFE